MLASSESTLDVIFTRRLARVVGGRWSMGEHVDMEEPSRGNPNRLVPYVGDEGSGNEYKGCHGYLKFLFD